MGKFKQDGMFKLDGKDKEHLPTGALKEVFDLLLFYSLEEVNKKLPIHVHLARKVLAGIDSEGNAERIFSLAKFVLSWLRTSMDYKHVEALVMMGCNYDAI